MKVFVYEYDINVYIINGRRAMLSDISDTGEHPYAYFIPIILRRPNHEKILFQPAYAGQFE